MMPIKQAFIGFCLVVWAGALWAQRSLAASEQMRFEAQVSRDTAALGRLLSEDLLYVHSNALAENKADFIRSVASGSIQYLAMRKLQSTMAQIWGKTALLQGIVEVQGLYQGNAFAMTLRYTSVYRKEKGCWQLVTWQSTRIPEPSN